MTRSVKLVSLATAVPPHIIAQTQAAEIAANVFAGRMKEYHSLSNLFVNAGIKRRFAARPVEWFLEEHGWADRMRVYEDIASALFVEVVKNALAKAHLSGADIDCVVVASSTGISTPTLDVRLSRLLGFRPDIERVPLFGLGCAAGVSGLGVASQLAARKPGLTVLFVAIELCTLAFRMDKPTKANIVATALFGDGAAACVLRNGGTGLAVVESSGVHLFPDTLDIMGWKIEDEGFGIILARSLPAFVERELEPAIGRILGRSGLSIADIDRFICHPGGMKVLTALEAAFHLTPGMLGIERAVVAEHGNMSSPTVLFVLERALGEGLSELSAMIAMGPGFTASCITLRREA